MRHKNAALGGIALDTSVLACYVKAEVDRQCAEPSARRRLNESLVRDNSGARPNRLMCRFWKYPQSAFVIGGSDPKRFAGRLFVSDCVVFADPPECARSRYWSSRGYAARHADSSSGDGAGCSEYCAMNTVVPPPDRMAKYKPRANRNDRRALLIPYWHQQEFAPSAEKF